MKIFRSGYPRLRDGDKLHIDPDPDDAGGGVPESRDGQGAGTQYARIINERFIDLFTKMYPLMSFITKSCPESLLTELALIGNSLKMSLNMIS